ncbi:MAG: hypothetical protein PHS41_10810 [Victivallaceae bacterium]|nr:hypothetical protein [Victivallaceae bacterium]
MKRQYCPNSRRVLRSVVFGILLFSAGGCMWMLPEGEPPRGEIVQVEPRSEKIFVPTEARERLISNLTIFAFRRVVPPGSRIRLIGDSGLTQTMIEEIFAAVSPLSGWRKGAETSEYHLELSREEGFWRCVLRAKTELWRDIFPAP